MKKIEVFSAGCPLCQEATKLAQRLAGESHQVQVHDMHQPEGAARARELGVATVPAVAIDGRLAPCCGRHGPDPEILGPALGE